MHYRFFFLLSVVIELSCSPLKSPCFVTSLTKKFVGSLCVWTKFTSLDPSNLCEVSASVVSFTHIESFITRNKFCLILHKISSWLHSVVVNVLRYAVQFFWVLEIWLFYYSLFGIVLYQMIRCIRDLLISKCKGFYSIFYRLRSMNLARSFRWLRSWTWASSGMLSDLVLVVGYFRLIKDNIIWFLLYSIPDSSQNIRVYRS